MSFTAVRRTAALGSLVALALPAAATGAFAGTPHWRLVATVHHAGYEQIAVTGANDAWAAGAVSGTTFMPNMRHWNGHTWGAVILPAAAKGVALYSISASSPKNVWVSGIDPFKGTQYYLNWNGSRWNVQVDKAASSWPVVLTLGPKDVWTFAVLNGSSTSYTRHLQAGKWATVPNPGQIGAVSAVSGHDIWAVGSQNVPVSGPAVLRWRGTAWAAVTPPVQADSRTQFSSVLARKADDVWVTGKVDSGTFQPMRPLAFHWDGKAWKDLTPPPAAEWLYSVTDDGAGGVWAIGARNQVFHYKAGKWTSGPVPVVHLYQGIEGLARIPGTTSLWGVGWQTDDKTVHNGLIFRYGG
jgi:hypothetical protein